MREPPHAGVIDTSGQCPACFGCARPCPACIQSAGDPAPADFATGLGQAPGALVEATWTCVCGRVYGTYHARRATCFAMAAPGRRQVRECVRCRRDLAHTHRLTDDGRQLTLTDPSREDLGDASSDSEASTDASAAAAIDPSTAVADDASAPAGADVSRSSSADASPRDPVDASLPGPGDASPLQGGDGTRACAWCGDPIPAISKTGRRRRVDADTCSKKCRQNRAKWKVERARLARAAQPMRFAYADPPYPGRGGLYPEGEEVDHAQLIAHLVATYPDGWALSTAADTLQHVLGLCPTDVRVGAWTRHARRTRSRRPVSAWEPLIVCGGRELPSDRPQRMLDVVLEENVDERELMTALVHRGRHRSYPDAMIGMKPPAFAIWLFEQLGAPGRRARRPLPRLGRDQPRVGALHVPLELADTQDASPAHRGARGTA